MIDIRKYKLPDSPGVYFFLSDKAKILYVGKAKSIKKRVTSYFNKSVKSIKILKMLEQATELKFQITNNEVEAFLLEANIIKTEKPKYNVLLKDSKTYPYIKITREHYPKISVTRKTDDKNADYYGPFVNVSGLRDLVATLQKIFLLRNCSEQQFKKNKLCMNFQIKHCSGPCENKISKEEYDKNVIRLKSFFSGQTSEIKKYFQDKMKECANNLLFEEAAVYRDRLKALNTIFSCQNVILSDYDKSMDGFIFHKFYEISGITVLIIRGGKLLGSKTYFFEDFIFQDTEESFILQFYTRSKQVPDELFIYTKTKINENLLVDAIYRISDKKIKVRKRKTDGLIQYGLKNGKIQTEIYKDKNSSSKVALEKLKSIFSLDFVPNYLECIDISHLSGEHTVGVSIVWKENEFHRKSYRKYKINTAENDDFKAIYEVFERKAKRILNEDEQIADIYIIDGGVGQLNAAAKAFKDKGLISNFMSISKGRSIADLKYESSVSIESIHILGRSNPLKLKKNDKLLLFVQKLRDEAHRFVITYSRNLALKNMTSSPLLNIKGLGKKRLKELLIEFPNIYVDNKIKVEDIVSRTNIPNNVAVEIIKYLNLNKTN